MRRTVVITATACLLLGACSSGGGTTQSEATPTATSSTPTASSSTTAPAPTAEPATSSLADVAAAIGCTGWVDKSADSPLTAEYGECVMPSGGRVQLYRFGTSEVVDTFWTTVAAFGVTREACVSVDLVALCPADSADIEGIKASLS